jgi:hypothetical protein
MDIASVEKDLQRRINESREWLKSNKLELISGLKIRTFPCHVKPVKFLDDPHWVERHGVRFRLEFVTPSGTYESYVDVRIKDTRSMSKKDSKSVANSPYIASYAYDQDQKTPKPKLLITYEHIDNTRIYKESLNLPIEEWYRDWLFKALRHKDDSNIFKFKKNI